MSKSVIVKKRSELNKPCQDMESVEEGFEVIDYLDKILLQEGGIGLAANQVGINKRVCIIRVPLQSELGGETQIFGHNFVNPTIIAREDPFIFSNEGCLSFPNTFIETIRYNWIKVIDDLEPEGREFGGLEAVVAAHEVDHTFGKTMFDNKPKTIGPNGKCPCESGQKFKKCCMPKLKRK